MNETMKCRECKYHDMWSEQGVEMGFVCNHPEQTKKLGLMYGRYFSLLTTKSKWCPLPELYVEVGK